MGTNVGQRYNDLVQDPGPCRARIDEALCDERNYRTSPWARWQAWTKRGAELLENRERRKYQKAESHIENGDVVGMYHPMWLPKAKLIWKVEERMIGTLLVALWVECESLLRQILSSALRFFGKAAVRRTTYRNLRKKLEPLSSGDWELLPGYHYFDGLRIITNAFKHQDGRYLPSKSDQIAENILYFFQVHRETSQIDYEWIYLPKLVVECRRFLRAILEALERFACGELAGRIEALNP